MHPLKKLTRNLIPSQFNEKDTIKSHSIFPRENRLQLPFPKETMPSKDKIVYSLSMEGSLSIIDLKILTGLPRAEIYQILEELILDGKVKNKRLNIGNAELIPEFYRLTKV